MANVDDFDFNAAMQVYVLPYRDSYSSERFPKEWLGRMCRNAASLAFAQTHASQRLDSGDLDPDTFEYVVCQMVLRVIRYTPLQSESNGSYTYDRKDDQSNPPSYDASPNLYVSKAEKELLNGKDSSRRKIGSVGMGLHRVYGM